MTDGVPLNGIIERRDDWTHADMGVWLIRDGSVFHRWLKLAHEADEQLAHFVTIVKCSVDGVQPVQ